MTGVKQFWKGVIDYGRREGGISKKQLHKFLLLELSEQEIKLTINDFIDLLEDMGVYVYDD